MAAVISALPTAITNMDPRELGRRLQSNGKTLSAMLAEALGRKAHLSACADVNPADMTPGQFTSVATQIMRSLPAAMREMPPGQIQAIVSDRHRLVAVLRDSLSRVGTLVETAAHRMEHGGRIYEFVELRFVGCGRLALRELRDRAEEFGAESITAQDIEWLLQHSAFIPEVIDDRLALSLTLDPALGDHLMGLRVPNMENEWQDLGHITTKWTMAHETLAVGARCWEEDRHVLIRRMQ